MTSAPTPDQLAAKVETKTLPPVPKPEVFLLPNKSGGVVERIGWPSVFEYIVRGTVKLPWRPTLDQNLAPDHPGQQPSSVPWVVAVDDLPAYDLLMATGALLDPRHTGSKGAPLIDNRKTIA